MIKHLSFCSWLTSLVIMPSRLIHVAACSKFPSFKPEVIFCFLCIYHKRMSIHLWWTFGSFPLFVYCQQCCYKPAVQLSLWVPTFTLFRYISRGKLVDCMVIPYLIFWGIAILFFTAITPFTFHQQLTGTPVSPYPYQHLLISEAFKMCFCLVTKSSPTLFGTPWTAACIPILMGVMFVCF